MLVATSRVTYDEILGMETGLEIGLSRGLSMGSKEYEQLRALLE